MLNMKKLLPAEAEVEIIHLSSFTLFDQIIVQHLCSCLGSSFLLGFESFRAIVKTWLEHNKIYVAIKTGSGTDLESVLANFWTLYFFFPFLNLAYNNTTMK